MNDSELESIRQQLIAKTGENIGSLKATAVSGGDINRAYSVTDGHARFFVKLNRLELSGMFEAEAHGLDVIRRTGAIRVPIPVLCGVCVSSAFIVMEYLDLKAQPDETRFAQQLAAMHLNQNTLFGFDIDNTIGSNLQMNSHVCDWVGFWQRRRLGFQLKLAERKGKSSRLIHSGLKLNEHIGEFFRTYEPKASLLHGDLWAGNYAADSTGAAVLFDPACYYGDHQTDLAMMELFGSPGARFFDVYNDQFAIDVDYRYRRDLYNLYHILNHLNLFGGSYEIQAQDMINRLLAEVGI